MRPNITLLAGVAVILSGCANGIGGLRPLTYQEPGESRPFVSYTACPNSTGQNVAPIVSAALLAAASKTLDGFGTALAKGAEGGKLPASIATTNTEIGQGLPLCVIVIRGAFQPEKGRMKAVPLPDQAGTKPLTVTAVGGTMRRVEPPPAA